MNLEQFIQQNPTQFWTIILLIMLWTLPWKGYALWRASRSGHKKWFVVFLIVNLLAIPEIVYLFWFSDKPAKNKNIQKADDGYLTEQENKIIGFLNKHGRITNNDVEELLEVSDSTATYHLEKLEKAQKITQHGEAGRGVFYTLR